MAPEREGQFNTMRENCVGWALGRWRLLLGILTTIIVEHFKLWVLKKKFIFHLFFPLGIKKLEGRPVYSRLTQPQKGKKATYFNPVREMKKKKNTSKFLCLKRGGMFSLLNLKRKPKVIQYTEHICIVTIDVHVYYKLSVMRMGDVWFGV